MFSLCWLFWIAHAQFLNWELEDGHSKFPNPAAFTHVLCSYELSAVVSSKSFFK